MLKQIFQLYVDWKEELGNRQRQLLPPSVMLGCMVVALALPLVSVFAIFNSSDHAMAVGDETEAAVDAEENSQFENVVDSLDWQNIDGSRLFSKIATEQEVFNRIVIADNKEIATDATHFDGYVNVAAEWLSGNMFDTVANSDGRSSGRLTRTMIADRDNLDLELIRDMALSLNKIERGEVYDLQLCHGIVSEMEAESEGLRLNQTAALPVLQHDASFVIDGWQNRKAVPAAALGGRYREVIR